MGVISSFLDGVIFGAELEHESLTMFPVRTGTESGVAYLSLAEAMEHTGRNGRGCSKKTAKTFLGELGAAEEKSYPAVGLGKAVRLTGPGLVGGALVVEGQLAHLAAFATPGTEAGGEDDDSRPTMARRLFRRRMYEDN